MKTERERAREREKEKTRVPIHAEKETKTVAKSRRKVATRPPELEANDEDAADKKHKLPRNVQLVNPCTEKSFLGNSRSGRQSGKENRHREKERKRDRAPIPRHASRSLVLKSRDKPREVRLLSRSKQSRSTGGNGGVTGAS